VQTNAINIILSYKYILYKKVAYTNYLINRLNIFINKTPVFSFGALFAHLFINKSIDLTSIGL